MSALLDWLGFALGSGLGIGTAVRGALWIVAARARRRYARTLENIARLEGELGMGKPARRGFASAAYSASRWQAAAQAANANYTRGIRGE